MLKVKKLGLYEEDTVYFLQKYILKAVKTINDTSNQR